MTLNEDDVKWIVNDLGELGVEVGGKQFFLYKGESIDYSKYAKCDVNGIAVHDDGSQYKYRRVGKREFGETCWPFTWMLRGYRDNRYTPDLNYEYPNFGGDPLQPVGGTTHEENAWKPLPGGYHEAQ